MTTSLPKKSKPGIQEQERARRADTIRFVIILVISVLALALFVPIR